MKFHHVGVPSTTPRDGEAHLEGADVYITDPEASPFRFEYVRFGANCILPPVLAQGVHIAYTVEDIEQEIAGQEIIIPPFDATPTIKAAFIRKDGAVVELMQMA